MGVTSIRLNEKEEKLVKYLKDYYHCDTSDLLKRSLRDLYEDIKDKEIVDSFETKKKAKAKFISFEDLIK